MNKKNIWIVDDEVELLNLMEKRLCQEGYEIECFTKGENVLSTINFKKPDIILLDLMLPGINGLEVCKVIKSDEKTYDIPVLLLSARSHEMDIINGFEAGADDYIVKPFNFRILSAKIKSITNKLDQKNKNQTSIIKIKDLIIDPNRYEVSIKNKLLSLTSSEFKVLYILIKNTGCVFSRYQLVESNRGTDYMVNDRSIDVLLGRLRKKLGIYGKYIETIYGVGYRFNVSTDENEST